MKCKLRVLGTSKQVYRPRPESGWTTLDTLHLGIVSDELFAAAGRRLRRSSGHLAGQASRVPGLSWALRVDAGEKRSHSGRCWAGPVIHPGPPLLGSGRNSILVSKFARRLPFDYSSEIRLVKFSEESTCPRTAAVSTASALFSVPPAVHNKPSAADRNANAVAALTITDGSLKQIRSIARWFAIARSSGGTNILITRNSTVRRIPFSSDRRQGTQGTLAAREGSKRQR
jgi:hypothetical protein